MPIRYARLLSTLALLVLFAAPAWAQTARVQIIHNAPDPGAAVVDVYVSEVGSQDEDPAVDDLAFRSATPFIDLPAGVGLVITIAPGDSEDADDGIFSIITALEDGETYSIIASGVLDPSMFEANPNGVNTAFTLLLETAQEEAEDAASFDLNVVHGSTDAPTIDVVARGVGTLSGDVIYDDVSYGDATDYASLEPATYILDVTLGSDNNAVVESFEADLSAAAGLALTALASGFLTPDNDQDGPGFGLLVVGPDGTTVLLPTVPMARAQIIHNAADPAAAVVDLYIEEISTEDPAVEDLPFRSATPFISLPAGEELTITVAPGDSDSAADGIASFPATLEDDGTYSIIASGVLDPVQFEANPNGRDLAFTLFIAENAQEASTDAGEVQFNVVHGSTDAPTVDVVARGVGTLVDDATYSDITDYIGVPPASYVLDVTTADGQTVVGSFVADLSASAGGALTILASGFLSPENDQNGPAFGLLAVFADGAAALLPPAAVSNEDDASVASAFALGGAHPNPLRTTTTVQFDLGADAQVEVEVFDVLGRTVLRTGPQARAAGAAQGVVLDASGLPSGAYLYRLTAQTASESLVRSGRLTVVR